MFTTETPTIPRFVLTGLTNGDTYEARVRAVNSVGESLYSALGSGTPVASRPGGGSTLALRAEEGGDTEVELSWLAPDDGGSPITGYTVQWRTTGQSFSSARQQTASGHLDDGAGSHERHRVLFPGASDQQRRQWPVVE